MAIKRVCDKCHTEISGSLFRLSVMQVVGIKDEFDEIMQGTNLDLCEGCLARIKKDANAADPRLA